MGLTSALRLAERGHDVDVLARDLPQETTSAVAAALWYPYRALPRDAVLRWSATGLTELSRLADEHPDSGVAHRWGTEYVRGPMTRPWWADAVPALERATDVPAGYDGGWRMAVPVADMPVYLDWLVGRLAGHGVTVSRAWLPALPPPSPDRVVVNCTGLAARALTGDDSLVPVRGQTVLLEQVGLEEWTLDASGEETGDLTYVVPRTNTIVVGGTAQDGVYEPQPDPQTAEAILARARVLVPELAKARVVGQRVGLRPGRPAVRLAPEQQEGGTVIHCYGHGGAGVTLSWGCADDVAALVEEVAREREPQPAELAE